MDGKPLPKLSEELTLYLGRDLSMSDATRAHLVRRARTLEESLSRHCEECTDVHCSGAGKEFVKELAI